MAETCNKLEKSGPEYRDDQKTNTKNDTTFSNMNQNKHEKIIQAASSSSSSTTNAAISLLDKYASITKGIEKTRKQTQQTYTQIDDIKNQINELNEIERPSILKKIVDARDEMADMKRNQIPPLKSKLQTLVDVYQHLGDSRMDMEQQTKNKRDFRKRRRIEFLNRCKDFRKVWYQNMKLDEMNRFSSIYPWIIEASNPLEMPSDNNGRHKINKPHFDSDESDNDDDIESEKNYNMDLSSIQKGLSSCNYDSELQAAIKNAQTSLQNQSKAQMGLTDALNDLENAKYRTRIRRERLERQRSQLKRIRNDIQQLELEIQQTESETREAKSIAETYAKDACRRKRMTKNTTRDNRPQDNDNTCTNQNQLNTNSNEKRKKTISNPYKVPINSCKAPSTNSVSYPYFESDGNCLDHHDNEDNNNLGTCHNAVTPSPSLSSHRYTVPFRDNSDIDMKNINGSNNNEDMTIPKINHFNSSMMREVTWKSNHNETVASIPANNDFSNLKNGAESKININTNQLRNIQYPHRAGRIWVSKQFSTTLEITSDKLIGDEAEDDEDEDLLKFVAFEKNCQTKE